MMHHHNNFRDIVRFIRLKSYLFMNLHCKIRQYCYTAETAEEPEKCHTNEEPFATQVKEIIQQKNTTGNVCRVHHSCER